MSPSFPLLSHKVPPQGFFPLKGSISLPLCLPGGSGCGFQPLFSTERQIYCKTRYANITPLNRFESAVFTRNDRVRPAVPRPLHLLGHLDENLRLHLRLRGARRHHHRLLHADGPAAEERAPAVRLAREGPQPSADHAFGAGGGGRLRGVLDAHPHLHPGQGAVERRARNHRRHGRLLLLRGSGLHQQQPQPHPLRLPGRELQEVL